MERPAERYMVMLGSYGLLQATAAMLLNLPNWTRALPTDEARRNSPRHQFGILGIIVLTTGVATVLFASRRYAVQGGEEFLSGAVSVSALLCSVAVAAILLSSHRWGRWFGVPVIGLLAWLVAIAMAYLEEVPSGLLVFRDLVWIYGSIVCPFGIAVFLVGICGHLDTLPDQNGPLNQPPPNLPNKPTTNDVSVTMDRS
jgi:hypothetical protein